MSNYEPVERWRDGQNKAYVKPACSDASSLHRSICVCMAAEPTPEEVLSLLPQNSLLFQALRTHSKNPPAEEEKRRRSLAGVRSRYRLSHLSTSSKIRGNLGQ